MLNKSSHLITSVLASIFVFNIITLAVNFYLSNTLRTFNSDISKVTLSSVYLEDESELVLKLFELTKDELEATNQMPQRKMISRSDLIELGQKK
ncbi:MULTISPECIES: hypothetical protein [Morganellaceae]|uniref:Uncharacterized protein n=1 Tax=Providencia rettgeri TaxID=587 RepID=A0AB35LEJ9_PRORE|nr:MULTISPECIES: hypothetical protein [Morganellaceae]ELB1544926.1 hypothetical protein [Morganella morganii]EKV4067945.1 hypothetical protein [Proteus mirabilis]MCI9768568.1 hypothetical protein [Proteus mirabilis]MCI9772158.1 hypothetical protein [Proteus mirabilis]MCI9775750.1 hypothetical protein [Proteus mirabilis]